MELLDSIISFVQSNTLIAIVIAVGLLILLYQKPKLFFGLLFLGLIFVATYYLITGMAGSGSKQKEKLLLEGVKQSDTDR